MNSAVTRPADSPDSVATGSANSAAPTTTATPNPTTTSRAGCPIPARLFIAELPTARTPPVPPDPSRRRDHCTSTPTPPQHDGTPQGHTSPWRTSP
ncbi:hypothetical protein GCM10010171_60650 [Actinokineospora fastidiosa]|uniref:Uncharacterized protein n=1 Tax=Actinokineospora fastidiosa TaxID=1816 RepID=A0A918LIR5_9PSEU|nr:hypothetical protein GCM10010171_60650 [Actinokineospora fastidiosa]